MVYQPLHHKYRPQTFANLVGQETIASTLTNAIEREKIAPAYLFTGPRGTGKTSSARILAKSLNCLNSSKPTPNPCGKCEVCRAIASGTALDVIEIDAASNTGVDNIREIIERSRFAPVQCRYKVYAIDECLTGDSLVQTSEGLMRIDDPHLKGKMVLSYNENTETWEYKKVLRWLERGTKETILIKTNNCQIRCTKNHLIRTETGWLEAQNVKEGMKILSPANVDVKPLYTNMAQTGKSADLQGDINLRAINTEANLITLAKFSNKQKLYNPYVNVDVTKNLISQIFFKRREEELQVYNPIGKDIRTEKDMESGSVELKTSSILQNNWKLNSWGLSMEHYLEMEALNIQTHTVDFLDYVGHMESRKKNGWSIKQAVYNSWNQKSKVSLIKGLAKNQLFAEQLVTLSYKKFVKLLNQITKKNQFLLNGFNLLHQKGWHGGTWMTVLCNSPRKEVLEYFFILRAFLNQKIKSLLSGLQIWDILPNQNLTGENLRTKLTTTSRWEQNRVANGCQIYNNIQFLQWTTNLAKVESVHLDGENKVYDLEVEDNHNFVANGLLVHNCHMLSTAAFNALLKTLEEPPPHVVFILATTDPQRVLSTIISRCQRFDYRRIPLGEMTAHLKYIATEETIAITDEAITLIAQIANGGLRDAESLLDQLSLLPDTITVEKVWDLVGAVAERDLLKLLQAIRCDRATEVLQQCRSLLDRGREPLGVLQNLASFYLNLLIAKTAPDRPELVAITETGWQQLCQEASEWELPLILQGQQKLKDAEIQLKQTTQPRLWLEVTLLGLLPAANVIPPLPSQKLAKVEEVAVSPTTTVTKSEPVNNKAPVTPSPVRDFTPETKVTPINSTTKTTTPTVTNTQKTERSPETPQPAIANSANHQEIWQQVIDSVRSRMTQTLLSQQCHLISFEGSRAIVGISNAKLRTLHQGKVADIEAAFAKVCQRQIKVQLEVATVRSQDAIAPSVATNTSQLSPEESAIQNPVDHPTQPEDRQEITPEEKPNTIKNGSKITPSNSDRDGNNNNIISPPLEKKTINDISQVTIAPVQLDNKNKLEPDLIQGRDNNLDNLQSISQSKPKKNFSLETTTVDNSTSDPELLQKAIEDLTQSFEGEVVQLDDKMQLSWQISATQETIVDSSLNNENNDISSLSTHIKNRPNVDEYDDDF
ncbi:MAG: hypothetical protein Tsb0014_22640 [Pleurocapsa sp.]